MNAEKNPLQDAIDTTKEIAGKSVPVGEKVGESVDYPDPIQDAIDTTKEIAGKSVPVAKQTDGDPNEPGFIDEAIDTVVKTTKDIAAKSMPVLQKAGDTIVNTAEKITHTDLNDDGTIGGE